MEEIKVGEYVRTKEGEIIKVKKEYAIFTDDDGIFIDAYMLPYEQKIVKHSLNIIDLIEVGDIIEIQTGLYNKYKIIIEDEDKLISVMESLKNWKLKTIVTKEQFNQVKYEV